MDYVITEAIYTADNDVAMDKDGRIVFTEGENYRFYLDDTEGVLETWLVTTNDYGETHVVSTFEYVEDENGDYIGGDWDWGFIDENFTLKEVLCRGEI